MSGSYRSANATVSAHSALAVTLSDSTIIPVTRALYIGSGGTLVVTMAEDGNDVTFVNLPEGTVFPIQVSKVLSTGSTASNIVALY